MNVFLHNFLEKENNHNLHVKILKEPLFNNSEGKLGGSWLFVDAYWQHYTKVYIWKMEKLTSNSQKISFNEQK